MLPPAAPHRPASHRPGVTWPLPLPLTVLALALFASACFGHRTLAEIAHTDDEDALLAAIASRHGTRGWLDERDRYGKDALHYAAERGFASAARGLAREGAAVDVRDRDGETPLFLAVRAVHIECVYSLLSAGADPKSLNGPTRMTPLHLAAQVDAPDIAQLLVRWGADVNATNRWHQTPIHLAAAQRWRADISTPTYLLDHGASPDARDARGFSPIETAAFDDDLPVLQLLASRGVPLDERTPRGSTLLDLALERNADIVAQYLFERGVPAPRSHDALPPLHLAARRNDMTFATTLLSFGASPTFAVHGQSALDIAESAGHTELAALLRASRSAAP